MAVRDLGCKGGPHLHELVASGWGGEADLSLVVEVQFPDDMGNCVSAGWALWWSNGGHG